MLTSGIGIACNLMLAGAKIAVGAVSGLVSVMADGFNNLSDCGSSAVSLVSFCVSEKPADKEHPYGHRLAEYVASMVTGFLVLFLAVELMRESISKIISGETTDTSWVVFLVLGISVVVKLGMFALYRIMAKRLNSDPLKAAATDSLCDCAATAAVGAGVGILIGTGFPADGWAGALVALFIVWQGLKILLEAGSKLLGQAPDKALTDRMKEIILSGNGVLGMHDLRVYGYGKGVAFATVHVEMDASVDALTSHTARRHSHRSSRPRGPRGRTGAGTREKSARSDRTPRRRRGSTRLPSHTRDRRQSCVRRRSALFLPCRRRRTETRGGGRGALARRLRTGGDDRQRIDRKTGGVPVFTVICAYVHI